MNTILQSLSPEALAALRAVAKSAADERYPDWRRRMYLPLDLSVAETTRRELCSKGFTFTRCTGSLLTPGGCEAALYLIG